MRRPLAAAPTKRGGALKRAAPFVGSYAAVAAVGAAALFTDVLTDVFTGIFTDAFTGAFADMFTGVFTDVFTGVFTDVFIVVFTDVVLHVVVPQGDILAKYFVSCECKEVTF